MTSNNKVHKKNNVHVLYGQLGTMSKDKSFNVAWVRLHRTLCTVLIIHWDLCYCCTSSPKLYIIWGMMLKIARLRTVWMILASYFHLILCKTCLHQQRFWTNAPSAKHVWSGYQERPGVCLPLFWWMHCLWQFTRSVCL